MKKSILFTLFALVAFAVSAQEVTTTNNNNNNRLEFNQHKDYIDHVVGAIGENGLLYYSLSKKKTKGFREFKVLQYDTTLQLVQTQLTSLEKNYRYHFSFTEGDKECVVYKAKKNRYVMKIFKMPDLAQSQVKFVLPRNYTIQDTRIVGDRVLLLLKKNSKRSLWFVDIATGVSQEVPVKIEGYSTRNLSFLDVQVFNESKQILLSIWAKKSTVHKVGTLKLLTYDFAGQLAKSSSLALEDEKNLYDVSLNKIGANQTVVVGNYGYKSFSRPEGLCFLKLKNDAVGLQKYYKFTDLTNFFSFFNEKKQKKMKKKKESKEAKGKAFDYLLSLYSHPLIQVNGDYIYIGEAYYPVYRQSYVSTGNGGMWVSFFAGYQFTHTLISKFSADGDIIWDKVIETWKDQLSSKLTNHVASELSDDGNLGLAFVNKNTLQTMMLNPEGELLKTDSTKIYTESESEKVKTKNSDIMYWYNDVFVTIGNQVIKTKEGKKKSKKDVIFIEKHSIQ